MFSVARYKKWLPGNSWKQGARASAEHELSACGRGLGEQLRTDAPLASDWSGSWSFRANALHCGGLITEVVVSWTSWWAVLFGSGKEGRCVLVFRFELRLKLYLSLVRMRGEESSDSESSRMEESSVRRSLETLCQELNMDEQTATEAMDNFTAIWNTYTLEVNNVL